jgi:hypothetical protein
MLPLARLHGPSSTSPSSTTAYAYYSYSRTAHTTMSMCFPSLQHAAHTPNAKHARHIFSCHVHIPISSYLRTSASNMYVFQVGARSAFSTMRDFINLIAHVECIEILLLKLINRTRNCTYLCLLDVVTFLNRFMQ